MGHDPKLGYHAVLAVIVILSNKLKLSTQAIFSTWCNGWIEVCCDGAKYMLMLSEYWERQEREGRLALDGLGVRTRAEICTQAFGCIYWSTFSE